MNDIQKTEQEIATLYQKLAELRKNSKPIEVKNYSFNTLTGKTTLLDMFADKNQMIVVHNMGQGCRYCTLWADGINGFLPHLENKFSVFLVSKDDPETQRQFANSRGWRFRMASHGGGEYIQEQSISPGEKNEPGIVCYERQGDRIYKKNASGFGPGDQFCPQWHILSLAGVGWDDWVPQFNYWKRPAQMDDGGQNLL